MAAASLGQGKIRHPGVRPSEVLLDATGIIKVSGFTLGELNGNGRDIADGYRPPEGLSDADMVYGVGALLVELLLGEPPSEASWDPDRHAMMVCRVANELSGIGSDPDASSELSQLVSVCLSHEPQRRPRLRHVLERLETLAPEFAGSDLKAWCATTVQGVLSKFGLCVSRIDDVRRPESGSSGLDGHELEGTRTNQRGSFFNLEDGADQDTTEEVLNWWGKGEEVLYGDSEDIEWEIPSSSTRFRPNMRWVGVVVLMVCVWWAASYEPMTPSDVEASKEESDLVELVITREPTTMIAEPPIEDLADEVNPIEVVEITPNPASFPQPTEQPASPDLLEMGLSSRSAANDTDQQRSTSNVDRGGSASPARAQARLDIGDDEREIVESVTVSASNGPAQQTTTVWGEIVQPPETDSVEEPEGTDATVNESRHSSSIPSEFLVRFQSVDTRVTGLDVKCHVGAADGGREVVIPNAGRGPCRVIGSIGDQRLVTHVSLTGPKTWRCFAGGRRACE